MAPIVPLSLANDRPPCPAAALPGLRRDELRAALIASGAVGEGVARMRAGQLFVWLHKHGATDFAGMNNIAKAARAALAERFSLDRPQIVSRQDSADGTIKWLLRFAPGVEAETVFIPDVGRAGALCLSSQVGCTLNCTFCHTGTQALVRNLTAAEIVAQVQVARDASGRVDRRAGREAAFQSRVHGDGRAAVQSRRGRRRHRHPR